MSGSGQRGAGLGADGTASGGAAAAQGGAGSRKRPCRVCSGFGDTFRQYQQAKEAPPPPPPTPVTPTPPPTTAAAGKAALPEQYRGCPEDGDTLGRAGWSVLHTMAAYFPEQPSAEVRAKAASFMALFADLYPCRECGVHLKSYLKEEAPATGSQQEFAQWMCRAHNEVNERLGKPLFDCSLVEERWSTGWDDGSCDT